MPLPILQTKLYLPQLRPQTVSRPRLLERLNRGIDMGAKLTLISAPAGFGKSTLLAEWLHSSDRACAWITLDEGDDTLPRFLAYLIAALQTVIPTIGAGLQPVLQSTVPLPSESLLTELLNELSIALNENRRFHSTQNAGSLHIRGTAIPSAALTLILDDYHVIEDPVIDNALTFLLNHLPPQLHVVIAGRADPALPLSQLRARRELTELRTIDLRFTAQEAATFLHKLTGLTLTPEAVTVLDQQTEGWIAGLQLAALSLEDATDSTDLLTSLRNSNRYILDYLADEVLFKRPPAVQEFLFKTSLLDRLCAPLCDALLAKEDGHAEQHSAEEANAEQRANPYSLSSSTQVATSQATIEQLERANLFLIPLDGERHWYRYHHLFANLLRRRLQQQDPALVAELHCRASDWFANHALLAEAFDHAIAAPDFTRAGAIITANYSMLYRRSEGLLVAEWFTRLPEQFVFADPILCLARAWVSYFAQRPQEIETYLTRIEELLPNNVNFEVNNDGDAAIAKRLRSSVAGLRGWSAYAVGHLDLAITLCHEALTLVDETQSSWEGLVMLFLASALREQGAMARSAAVAEKGIAISRAAGNLSAGLGAVYHLAECYRLLGQLHQAETLIEEALTYAAHQDAERAQDVGYVLVAQAELLYEQNALDACRHALARCADITRWRSTKSTVPAAICEARLHFAQGKRGETHAALLRAQQELRSWEATQEASHLIVQIVTLQLAMQATSAVAYWQQETQLDLHSSIHSGVSYANEAALILLARIVLAQIRVVPAASFEVTLYEEIDGNKSAHMAVLDLLERLYKQAKAAARNGRVIQIRILQSIAHWAAKEEEPAFTALGEALMLAEPENYIRTFVDEGAPMAQLLYRAAEQQLFPDYVGRLLAAFDEGQLTQETPAQLTQERITQERLSKERLSKERMTRELVEPLTAREIEVLQFVAEGMTNQEIANKLVLTVGTVKVHTRNIYGKLGVRSRTQAVAKARAFGIV